MDQGNWDLTAVPSADTVGSVQLGERDVPFMQPLADALEVVLEPVPLANCSV